jgi:hypothetical protein
LLVEYSLAHTSLETNYVEIHFMNYFIEEELARCRKKQLRELFSETKCKEIANWLKTPQEKVAADRREVVLKLANSKKCQSSIFVMVPSPVQRQ